MCLQYKEGNASRSTDSHRPPAYPDLQDERFVRTWELNWISQIQASPDWMSSHQITSRFQSTVSGVHAHKQIREERFPRTLLSGPWILLNVTIWSQCDALMNIWESHFPSFYWIEITNCCRNLIILMYNMMTVVDTAIWYVWKMLRD